MPDGRDKAGGDRAAAVECDLVYGRMSLPCPQCTAKLPGDAERCPECGHARAELSEVPSAPEGEAMAVCRGCGVIAPTEREVCEVCGFQFSEAPLELPRLLESELFWVAVRTRFKCRACGHRSPLNHLDMDGSALCVNCGTDQVFRSRGWNRPLKHAHGVGDLAGPGSEGRFPNSELLLGENNAFAPIGVSATWALSGSQGTSAGGGSTAHESLEIEAAPGHPLCDTCRAPLGIEKRAPELLTVKCVACNDSKSLSYPLPAQVGDRVAGVISREQSSGQKDVKALLEDAGARTVKCGECGAPLDLSGACNVVTCQFCRTTSRIPERVLLEMGFKNPKPLIWWLLFAGPSSRRVEAEQGARRDQKEQHRKAQHARSAASAGHQKPSRSSKKQAPRLLNVGIAVAVTAAVLAAFVMLASVGGQ